MNLFIDEKLTQSSKVFSLNKQESHHAVKVLRLKPSDEILVTNTIGILATAKINLANEKLVEGEILSFLEDTQHRAYKINIYLAPTKINDRLEWFVEKSTEIGVDKIVPIICSRSERKATKTQRLEKLMVSASKQSLKASFPKIYDSSSFKDAVKNCNSKTKLIAYCGIGYEKLYARELIKQSDDISIFIGPEGDFTDSEIKLAILNGFIPVSLGDSRLRTETAALFSVAMANSLLG